MTSLMYINPTVLGVLISALVLLLAIVSALTGVIWRAAVILGDIKTAVAVVVERLDSHIRTCGPQKSH